jgi:hypothetical protein
MTIRRILLSSSLIGPALLFASCDSGKDSPAGPNTAIIGNPGTASSSAHGLSPSRIRLPRPSAAEVAAAVKEDAANTDVVTEATGVALHDPTVAGMAVKCISGAEGTGVPSFHGEARRFRFKPGCELNTFDGDADPNNNAAFVITTQNALSGKLLTQIQRLDFAYAGGPPSGGVPRLSIPIDENGDRHFDYPTEQYAFIDASGCNNGDDNVGFVRGDDDPTCLVTYKGTTYQNFSAFEAAYPGGRIAPSAQALTFIAVDQPAHYLIYRVTLR